MNHLLRPLLAAACLCADAVVSSAQGPGPQADDIALESRLADRLARHPLGPVSHAVPEQDGEFVQRQPPVRRALDQREQRPQLGFGRDQRGKARPQHKHRAANAKLRLAAQPIRSRTHRLTTAPLDSRFSV